MLVSFILNMIRICTVDASHACFKDLMHLQAASFCSLTGHTIIQDVTGTVSKIRQLHLTVSIHFMYLTHMYCIEIIDSDEYDMCNSFWICHDAILSATT